MGGGRLGVVSGEKEVDVSGVDAQWEEGSLEI